MVYACVIFRLPLKLKNSLRILKQLDLNYHQQAKQKDHWRESTLSLAWDKINVCVYFRHEIAELNGLISQSFGIEEYDRHLVFFKKVSSQQVNSLA